MDIKDIKILINEVSNSNLYEFRYEENGVKLQLSKGTIYDEKKTVAITDAKTTATISQENVNPANNQENVNPANNQENLGSSENSGKKSEIEKEIKGNIVTSPLVGTVYLAPAEDEPPFVSVGDKVKKGQTLAIVEAMKLMNEIESKFDGVVKEVLVDNESPVEFGQEMFVIE